MGVVFVYFATGNIKLYNRAILSIWSLINNYSAKDNFSIEIYTDDPSYYNKFLPFEQVRYQLLSQEDILELMGVTNLIHRVKIGIIKKTTILYPNHKLVYIDSDTFFYKPFSPVIEKITSKVCLMHMLEYPMRHLGSYSVNDKDRFRIVYETLKNTSFTIHGKTINILPEEFNSWNAGVIGLDPAHFEYIDAVYELTDQLYLPTRNHACEQYAFSYILETKSSLIACNQQNRHYWHHIEKKITDEILEKLLVERFTKNTVRKNKKTVYKLCHKLLGLYHNHEYALTYKAMIAFQQRKFLLGYKYSLLTLLMNPFQKLTFFRDVAYHTKHFFYNE
jgi:hypothetical protein